MTRGQTPGAHPPEKALGRPPGLCGAPRSADGQQCGKTALRNPVTGCKNYYGSGRVWSAQLAAVMFTVLQTILLWGLNPQHWLQAFLQACADHGGHPPPDLSEFLPWTMSAERKHKVSQPWSVPLPPLSGERSHLGNPQGLDTS